jgi:hypothetical protein
MLNIDDKLGWLQQKVGWLELAGLLIKCAILWFYESALAKEFARKQLIEKQQNEAKQSNQAEQQANLPASGTVVL